MGPRLRLCHMRTLKRFFEMPKRQRTDNTKPNLHKIGILQTLRTSFGELHKIEGSESLFRLGEDAAPIYIRYSKVHAGGAFFGIREVDLRQLEGYNSFFCFLVDDGSAPLFVPYEDFEEVFRNAQTAKDGQYKV